MAKYVVFIPAKVNGWDVELEIGVDNATGAHTAAERVSKAIESLIESKVMNDTGHAVRGVLLALAEDADREGVDFDPNDEVFEALQGVATFARNDSILVSEDGFLRMAKEAWKRAKTNG